MYFTLFFSNLQNIEIDDLFAQCNSHQGGTERPEIYPQKFIFVSTDKVHGSEDSEIYGNVTILQKNRTETIIDFAISRQKVCSGILVWQSRNL